MSNTYISLNSAKIDTSDAHDRYLLYTQFAACYCKGSSIAPLWGYAHNPIYKEMSTINQYFTSADEKKIIYLRGGKGNTNETEKINRDDSDLSLHYDSDLSLSLHSCLKTLQRKKMRLHVTGYYQGEYLYSLANEGLVEWMNYKEYGLKKTKSVAT